MSTHPFNYSHILGLMQHGTYHLLTPLQIAETPNAELRLITSVFNKVHHRGKDYNSKYLETIFCADLAKHLYETKISENCVLVYHKTFTN